MKMKRNAFLLMTVTMMLFCLYASASTQAVSLAIVNNPNPDDRLNLRSEPTTNSTSVAKYFNGTYVTVVDQYNDEWVFVEIGNTNGGIAKGYMSSKYLAFDGSGLSITTATPVLVIQNPYGQGLHLRKMPDITTEKTASSSIGLFRNGTEVMVLGVLNDWYHVQVGGMTGFMRRYGFQTDLGGTGSQAKPQTEGKNTTSTVFSQQQTIQDTHGYTVTASVTEAVQGKYLITVNLSLNGVMLNGTLLSYNVYADGSYLGRLEVKGSAGNTAEGVPVSFENSFSPSGAVSQIELRPVWSRSGQLADGEEEADTDNRVVFTSN